MHVCSSAHKGAGLWIRPTSKHLVPILSWGDVCPKQWQEMIPTVIWQFEYPKSCCDVKGYRLQVVMFQGQNMFDGSTSSQIPLCSLRGKKIKIEQLYYSTSSLVGVEMWWFFFRHNFAKVQTIHNCYNLILWKLSCCELYVSMVFYGEFFFHHISVHAWACS